jgi:hypothetical protein
MIPSRSLFNLEIRREAIRRYRPETVYTTAGKSAIPAIPGIP